jgi:hypothetical protein
VPVAFGEPSASARRVFREQRITVAGEDGKRRRMSKRELGIARLADRMQSRSR